MDEKWSELRYIFLFMKILERYCGWVKPLLAKGLLLELFYSSVWLSSRLGQLDNCKYGSLVEDSKCQVPLPAGGFQVRSSVKSAPRTIHCTCRQQNQQLLALLLCLRWSDMHIKSCPYCEGFTVSWLQKNKGSISLGLITSCCSRNEPVLCYLF